MKNNKKLSILAMLMLSASAGSAYAKDYKAEKSKRWINVSGASAVKEYSGSGSAGKAALAFIETAVDDKIEALPEWMQRFEIELDINAKSELEYDILTVQPLYQSKNKKHTFFNQSRIAYGDDRTTLNIGFGYRNMLLDNKMIIGANVFYDHEFPYDHRRYSAGLEVKSSAVELSSNFYNAQTDWHQADAGFEERALSGQDYEIGVQVPYMPWARVFAKKFYFDSQIATQSDTRGEVYSLRMRPLKFLEVESGFSNSNNQKDAFFTEVRFSFGFGRSYAEKSKILFDRVAFRLKDDVSDLTLEKVRRQNTIVKQRRTTGGATGSASVTMARGS